MNKFRQMCLLFGLGLWAASQTARAQEDAGTDESDKSGVLDFEGDVIEGQRKRPDLFLQSEVQNLTLDAILYLRKDFNDFHQVDRNRRPGYYQRRTRGGNP